MMWFGMTVLGRSRLADDLEVIIVVRGGGHHHEASRRGEGSSELGAKKGWLNKEMDAPASAGCLLSCGWLKHALGTKMVGMGDAMRLLSQVPLLAPWW
jgi:hypothetical protein